MEKRVTIHFSMPTYDMNGKRVISPFEHGVKESYFTDKVQKMAPLTEEQVAKWIIKQAYKGEKQINILTIDKGIGAVPHA